MEGFDRRIVGGKAVAPRSRVKELLKIPHEIVISVDVDADFLGVPVGMGGIAILPQEKALVVLELAAVRIDAGKTTSVLSSTIVRMSRAEKVFFRYWSPLPLEWARRRSPAKLTTMSGPPHSRACTPAMMRTTGLCWA